jgi:hypothetical protein
MSLFYVPFIESSSQLNHSYYGRGPLDNVGVPQKLKIMYTFLHIYFLYVNICTSQSLL